MFIVLGKTSTRVVLAPALQPLSGQWGEHTQPVIYYQKDRLLCITDLSAVGTKTFVDMFLMNKNSEHICKYVTLEIWELK